MYIILLYILVYDFNLFLLIGKWRRYIIFESVEFVIIKVFERFESIELKLV